MIITKHALPRRTFLRGVGATLALPFLDAMVPALKGAEVTTPVRRLGVVYVPNGMSMPYWTPATQGAGFELTPILQPLAPFRDQMLVLTNLAGAPGGGSHAGAATRFLTGVVATLSEGNWRVCRRVDGPARSEANGPGHAVGIARALSGQ